MRFTHGNPAPVFYHEKRRMMARILTDEQVLGIAREAASGKRILCIYENMELVNHDISAVAYAAHFDGATPRVDARRNRIKLGNGFVQFLTCRQDVRGIACDALFLDFDVNTAKHPWIVPYACMAGDFEYIKG